MKRFFLLIAALMAGCMLASCAATPAPGASPRNPDAPPRAGGGAGEESAALGLINLWRVSDAAGESPATWLRIDVGELQLWRGCGMINAAWNSTETLFVAAVVDANGKCVTGRTLPSVAWLESAAAYRAADEGWELLDSDGSVVARLAVDGAPEPDPEAAEFYTEPPQVTDATRQALRTAAPMPEGVVPATSEALLGKWVPVAYQVQTDPHVQFLSDGTWEGSDGCNGAQGRWAIGESADFLASSGPSTLIGCEGAPVPSWVAQAARAGVDGEWLLLFDQDGSETGRLERA